jgi:antitoxin (DNA-binding transcriptional repressor) of toxin-antitoxin stability system
MKRVTASEARKNWFRLLDEVAAGETVVIERKGRRIVIRRESAARARRERPDYSALLEVSEPERAAEWRWEWAGPEGDVTPQDEG